MASFFFALPIFHAAKTRLLADLDRFLGFPFPKNAQEYLLRKLTHCFYDVLDSRIAFVQAIGHFFGVY